MYSWTPKCGLCLKVECFYFPRKLKICPLSFLPVFFLCPPSQNKLGLDPRGKNAVIW